jgi:formylglycine-generating enzyme required for sulfatase activity
LILDLGGGVTMDVVEIQAGTFNMGSTAGDDDEDPVHSITISKKFFIGKYEVTQDQWQAMIGSNPSEYNISGNHPVEKISWNDGQNFCNVLASWIGRSARMPTEAEWEYACRAGSTTRYYFGDDFGIPPMLGDYAWYASSKDAAGEEIWETQAVGQLIPNDFGLYDMHGNVWEWCQDLHNDDYYAVSPDTDPLGPDTGSFRVMRGGGWPSFAPVCRSANRGWFGPSSRADDVGLRVVLDAE